MIVRFYRSSAVVLTLILTLLPWLSHAKKDGPRIASAKFDEPLMNLFYFDDSETLLGQDKGEGTLWRSTDAGESWKEITDDEISGNVWDIWPHPYNNQRAYVLGLSHTHWITNDQGKTWSRFSTEATSSLGAAPLSFHGRDPKKVIWQGQICDGIFDCEDAAYYTDDDFGSITKLRSETRGCYWAVSTPEFGVGIEPEVEDRILCVARGPYSPWSYDNRLFVSDNHFLDEVEPLLDNGRSVPGIISMAPVKKYMVAAAKAEGSKELALYVTDDSSQWHRAEFGRHRIEEDAYTILESTNYSIQLDVLNDFRPQNPMGVLFTSNSNGTYFTRNIEHTNRNLFGMVDFEKIQGIQGIVLVNVVDNWDEVERNKDTEKQIVSQVSFDDGRTFHDLKVGGEKLHLHSVSDLSSAGRVYSSPAPGIVMGIGNTGKYLKSYDEGDLFVSDDAGLTWREGLGGAHKYEFGGQGSVIIAADDVEATSHIQYSINHGRDWKKADLGEKIRVKLLTTVPDSTSLKFMLVGTSGKGSKQTWSIFMIDFEGLHERKCGKKDFERWPARVDDEGNPSCIMGHKQFYRRRKADADCFVDEEFIDPVPEFEPCKCTKADFECDFNFVRSQDRRECIPSAALVAPEGACKGPEDTYLSSSGWRLIPGNECDRVKGEELDKDIQRSCADTKKTPTSGEIAVEKTVFDAASFNEYHYLERTEKSIGDDETIIMRTSEQEIFLTKDHGKTWHRVLDGEPITAVVPHHYFNDVVYFLTGSTTVYYSIDRAEHVHKIDAPAAPSRDRVQTLRFHPDYKDWLLWAGASNCPGPDCHTIVHYSKDRGDDWNTLLRYAKKCEFIKREARGPGGIKTGDISEQLVYCEQFENEDPTKPLQLLSSDNWFADKQIQFPDILDFATMSEFIIVAAKTDDQKSLKVDASVDGHTFAAAKFPPNFNVPHQQAYTVLDSSTHAVFLHVTVSTSEDHEYGSIIKSNSNGTSYVLTLSAVNRDNMGYVDFEKMQGLEGVALVNVVANLEQTQNGEKKKLRTMITHNDGGMWSLLPPPLKDAEGHNYPCVKKQGQFTEKCALHIHSYTERDDKGATFSSPTAVGLMIGVGNVGEYLGRRDQEGTDTFITRDGGLSWHSIKKGSYLWEYGDQGSIIVIVDQLKPTQKIFYSLDEGISWTEYYFSSGIDMQIQAISTVPSDTSRNFLLWGREVGKSSVVTVNLDFTGLPDRQRPCDLKEDGSPSDDYDIWEPRHPNQDNNCLFGHVAQYHRKKPGAKCYNGNKVRHLPNIERNCSCTRQDFEWYVAHQPGSFDTADISC